MKKIDLHVHTNKSDGTFSPEEVVDYAHSIGLQALAITDHDTVAGIDPALKHAKKFDLEIVPGIEISAEWTQDCPGGTEELEIHMLGYFIDWKSQDFQKKLEDLSLVRMKRAERIIEKLKNHGISIDMEDVQVFAHSTESIGRLHIAQAMLKEGCVPSINRAFDQYIGNNKPCYVPKYQLNPEEAVQFIKEIKGIAVIAHPGLLNLDFARNLIRRLAKRGLDGIEVYYPEHRGDVITGLKEMAQECDLLITGGTDCHGLAKKHILMGTLDVPYELLERMKQRIKVVA